MLSKEEILFILELIKEKYGPGYAEDRTIGTLQAKLYIMLELQTKAENR